MGGTARPSARTHGALQEGMRRYQDVALARIGQGPPSTLRPESGKREVKVERPPGGSAVKPPQTGQDGTRMHVCFALAGRAFRAHTGCGTFFPHLRHHDGMECRTGASPPGCGCKTRRSVPDFPTRLWRFPSYTSPTHPRTCIHTGSTCMYVIMKPSQSSRGKSRPLNMSAVGKPGSSASPARLPCRA